MHIKYNLQEIMHTHTITLAVMVHVYLRSFTTTCPAELRPSVREQWREGTLAGAEAQVRHIRRAPLTWRHLNSTESGVLARTPFLNKYLYAQNISKKYVHIK